MFPSLFPFPKSGGDATGAVRPPPEGRPPPRRTRCAAKIAAGVAIPVFALLAVLLGLVLQSQPIALPEPRPTQDYLSRARTLIHDTVRTGTNNADRKRLVLTAEDLAAAANFALLRKNLQGRAACTIENTRLKLVASIRLPGQHERYLNLRLIADDAWPKARIKRLKLGRISVPSPLVNWLVDGALRFTPLGRFSRFGEQLVEDMRIRDGRLAVSLYWNRDVLARAEGLVTDLADKERLLVYHDKLAEIVDQPHIKRYVRLGTLMQPLFALARSRSDEHRDPVAENRALIVVLAAYVNGKSLSAALFTPTSPPPRRVLLNKRVDTAQHFMGSASLAMSGQDTLVDMIGLAKEMHDTHDGSGFSFTDLAADEAGALFGRLAVRDEAKARMIQDALGRNADESQFMPPIKDLPENLRAEDFAGRFKDIESPEFQAMKEQIAGRIEGLPLYRMR